MKKIIYFSVLLFSAQGVYATDDDTQLRLNQQLQQQQLQREQHLLDLQQQEIMAPELPAMVIDGKKIEVALNVEDVGRALYIAVMQKQWQAATIYLEAYLKLENYDQSLALFAQGALARVQAQPKQAEQYFRQALNLQPQNQIIKLELARVLTELQKNQEAKQLFNQVKQQLAVSEDKSALNITRTIDRYLQGLQQRDAWHGSIAFGTRYADNLNSSSERYQVVLQYGIDNTGNVVTNYLRQETPDPVEALGQDYEASLTKRWSLAGNHGIALRGLSYGQIYSEEPEYNEITFNFNTGYSYQSLRHQFLLAPVFEHKYYGHDPYYNAVGARTEWMHFIGRDKALKVEVEAKDFHYSDYTTQDGMEYASFATFWKLLPAKQWTFFGGFDYVDHNTEEKVISAYQQEGIRIGLSKQFVSGFNATLSNFFRWRQYDSYAGVFETRRHDFEQNYNLLVSAPKWQFYGLTPTLNYRYTRNKSNVDWLYSYDKHNVSLKLEHRF